MKGVNFFNKLINVRIYSLVLIWKYTKHPISRLPKDVLKIIIQHSKYYYFSGIAYPNVGCEYSGLNFLHYHREPDTRLYEEDVKEFIGKGIYYEDDLKIGTILDSYVNNNNDMIIIGKIMAIPINNIVGLCVKYNINTLSKVKTIKGVMVEIPMYIECKRIKYL